MFNTADSVPRSDGRIVRRLLRRGELRKNTGIRKLSSVLDEILFATGDFLRKYLVNEPLLARKGEAGYDPGVEAEVRPALTHKPRYTATAEKMIKSEEAKKWKPRKGYKTAPAGKDIVADVEGQVPGKSTQSIKAGIFKQMKDITVEKEPPPAPPPEMLPEKQIGKTKVRGADYEGRPNIQDLWDPTQAAKPTTVIEAPNLTLRKRPRIPRNQGEREALQRRVSAGAEAFRDPIASHLARVEVGLTPNLLEKHKKQIPGVPALRLNPVREAVERHRAQGIRDILAEKGWAYRKNVLNPLRAHRRQQLGRPPVQPIGKETVKGIHAGAAALGGAEIGKAGQVSRVSPTPNINVGGATFHPAVVKQLQGRFEKDIGRRLGTHQKAAAKIRNDIHARVHANASPLEAHRQVEETGMAAVKKYFDPGRKDPLTPLETLQTARWTGYKEPEVKALHKAFRRHTYLGETQAGEDLLRRKVFPQSLKKVPATLEKPVAAAIGSPLLRRTGIGLGIAGAVGAGAYLTHKLRQRRQTQLKSMARLIRFQQVEDAYSAPTPWHRKEARRWLMYPESRSRALEQTIGKIQRIHRDIRAPKSATGEIIGERGRTHKAEWQKPWFRRTLVVGGITAAALGGRGIYGKLKKTSQVAAGLMEKELPISAGERFAANVTSGNWLRAIGKKFPRTSSVFSSASQRAGSLGARFKQEAKTLKETAAERANRAIEGQVGEITGGKLRRNKAGVTTKVEWDNPAVIKENLERARKIQERGAQITAHGKAAESRAARAGATRASMEEALKKREPPEKKLSSLLSLIRFQLPVPVREHTRGPRSTQPKSKQKQWQQGLLVGIGGTAALAGTGYGAKLGYGRLTQRLSREEAAKQASHEVDERIKKRAAEILGSETKKVLRKTKKIIPHTFNSRLREIRFSAWENIRSKLAGPPQQETSPVHDIAVGAIEGGLAFPASAYVSHKLLGPTPSLGRKMIVGGVVGGVATGAVGLGLGALLRKRERTKRQQQQQWSSKLKEVRFQQPRRNQRMLVARDRYSKQIRERDIDVANQHYIHSALLGAGLGAILRKKPANLSRAVLGGAVAGVGIQKATRIYGAQTRDPFGERSITAKRVERAPTYAGLGTLAYVGLRKARKLNLSSRVRPIQFKEKWVDNPLYPKGEKRSIQEVPIKHIVSHQDAVKERTVKKYKKRSGRELPTLHKIGRKYYVEDGNHRIVSKLEKGEKTVRASVRELRARLREIRFQQEPQPRKHNVGAGLLVAATGIPLYKGAGKFARIGLRRHIDRFVGNPVSHGKQVADYLEATQHVLNRGATGKLAGMALRNPKHPVVKALLPGAKSGIKKLDLEHYSSFRSSPTEALDAWAGEVAASMRPGKARDAHIAHYEKLTGHLQNLWSKGYNETEALRHVAADPVHENFFRRLSAHKAGPTKHYQKITAGLAAVPATAGAAVAATTRKNDGRGVK